MNLRSVSQVFDVLAAGRRIPAARPDWRRCSRPSGAPTWSRKRDARFINDRVHANIQKDRTYSVVPRIFGGVTTAADLRKIADVADKYNVRMVKITGGQRIDLLGLTARAAAGGLEGPRHAVGPRLHEGLPTCKTCVGSEFCRFGVGDSRPSASPSRSASRASSRRRR
jgi:nitrite reductase (NADH) large subunit